MTPSHPDRSPSASRRQRGVTLIEALVALLVMSFGMLALVGLMSNLRRGSDLAKQRSEAMRIARADIAEAKTFAELTRSATTPTASKVYDGINGGTRSETPVDSNTTYTVSRTVSALANAEGLVVRVNVGWRDRAGDTQFINLDSVIAKVDPLFSAAIGFAPPAGPVTLPSARSPAIPAGAKQLDGKTSAFIPSSTATRLWVFNNFTGVITGLCNITPGVSLSTITAADVESCKNNTIGYLLSGVIRFSNTNPANPSQPEAFAIPMTNPTLVTGSYSLPHLDPATQQPQISGGAMVLDSFTATPPTVASAGNLPECFQDAPATSPSTQPFVTYNCIVYPDTATRYWSGKLELTGLTIGTTASEYKVCRYSADYNGSGGMFTADWKALENEEHPAVYGRVGTSLARQNFLVVRGNVSCPTAPGVDPSAGVFANYSTVQLQPSSP
ncbi:Tfp pilus assembly protein PilV [Pelomonas saccharophila]|uniref:Tfp pilus assembly protein PilV n=1 Tax=Roseateles saccharophilus TaxID=304 RepID=A0ABU1YHG5_ROSSA|nr:prepilin-type N-terminal cleavage/methylation domain-containing protein [Roseateles saccharophilus]MDR7267476.1 Tfp pilus assembly protein PilV [Roseateles saccharophilus]